MSEPFYWASRKAYYINYTVNGKRHKKCLGKTKSEAFRAWRDWLQAGEQMRRGEVRFQALASDWICRQTDRCERGEVSKGFLARACRTLEVFCTAHPGLLAKNITPAIATGWLPKGSSAAYEYTEVGVIRQVLKWGHDSGIIPRNPLAGMQLSRGKRREGCVDQKAHEALLAAASDDSFKRLLQFCWWTGCRPIELRHLRWEHMNDDCSTATLKEHKTARKTGRPRVIYFGPEAWQALLSMRQEAGHVFLNRLGAPWTKNAVVQRMRRLRDATGLELTAYAYRHGYATRALEKGLPVADVAELLGTSIEIISRNYSHIGEKQERLKQLAHKVG